MTRIIKSAIFSLYLASSSAQSAPLPLPVQSVLSQIKGEWVLQEEEVLAAKMSLQADGRGQLVNRDGSTEITWQIDAGAIKIKLLTPTVYHSLVFEDGLEIPMEVALEGLTLQFHKFEGLGSILWKMTSQTLTSYPENPERPSEASSTVSENSRLIAARQFKNFAPVQGQTLSFTLPNYTDIDAGIVDHVSISLIGRLDPANVLTILQGPELGQSSFYWTLDNGRLRISDGKGYTAAFKVYKKDAWSHRLLADVQSADRSMVAETESIHVNETIRAQGFQAGSDLFQGCWEALAANYCFSPNRVFTMTYSFPDETPISANGLWTLENGKVVVKRFIDSNSMVLEDVSAMLDCEKELADDAIIEKSCQVYQSRSYELLNQNSDSLGVYRILNHRGSISTYAHVFKRVK